MFTLPDIPTVAFVALQTEIQNLPIHQSEHVEHLLRSWRVFRKAPTFERSLSLIRKAIRRTKRDLP